MNSVISVKNLSKHYGDSVALRDVTFDVAEGEIVAVLGPNGAGKTTTIEILEGFRKRTAGDVMVLGEDPEHANRLWRSQIGLVLQSTSLEGTLTVVEALRLFRSMYAQPRKLREVLIATELLDIAEERIATLSGGQQRRLDFAIGIVGNPKLLFLDEPSTGLDPEARQRAWQSVNKLSAQGMTTVLTTHYLDEAEKLANRVIIISGGGVVANATPAEIESRGSSVVQFDVPKTAPIRSLPIYKAAHVTGNRVVIRTDDTTRDADAVLSWAKREHVALTNFEVKLPSLEDVYLALTAKQHKESGND